MKEELSSKKPQLQQPLSPSRESSRRPQPGLAAGTPPGASASTGNLIVPKAEGLKITGTFLDEISHDIPHQNWGEKERDADFRHMKSIGIDGKKAIMGTGKLTNDQAVSVAEHETNCGTGRHHTRQAPRTILPTI